MIVYDLQCSKGHMFEGWFDNLESFTKQDVKDMISCPTCNDTSIKKVLSPVSVRTSSSSEVKKDLSSIDYQKLAKGLMEYINNDFEDTGVNFTKEALKIHCGVSEKRNIKGVATLEEEEILKDEGVQFFKIPTPKTDDKKKN